MFYTKNELKILEQPSWQFTIFMIFNFVLKIKKNNKQKKLAILKSRFKKNYSSEKISTVIKNNNKSCDQSLKLVKNEKRIKQFLGNPIFIFNYYLIFQNKGHTFKMQLINGRDCKSIINSFFLLNKNIWEYGLFETTFDFLRNCGTYNKKDFFIDLGDFTNDLMKIEIIVEKEFWKTRLDYKCLKLEDKNYYDLLAKKYFNLENIYKLWRKRV